MHAYLNFATRLGALTLAALALGQASVATAQPKDIKIGLVYSRTGPLEAYGKQTQAGVALGLDYATGGTMRVNGRKIVLVEKDDQGKPDVGKSQLASAYADDKVDLAVGTTGPGRGAGDAAGGRGDTRRS
jgi:branched-chain amino acid transport system substrate-binding protein